jgi:hypothetical protein
MNGFLVEEQDNCKSFEKDAKFLYSVSSVD